MEMSQNIIRSFSNKKRGKACAIESEIAENSRYIDNVEIYSIKKAR